MTLPIVYHPDYMAPLKPGHRFPMSKYGYLRKTLIAGGILPEVGGFLSPAEAPLSLIASVHQRSYVDRMATQTLRPDEVRQIGLPNTPAVSRRARLSAAGTTLAARLALEHGIACNMAGGSHHAGPAGGAGFCVVNDVAVAARTLLDEGHVRRITILDLDVHQGDGTALIFANEPKVTTISLHAEKNYPAHKASSDIDISLPDGMADAAYLAQLHTILSQVFQPSPPDLLFLNAGVDVHKEDRLGRLALSLEGIRAREAAVFQAATHHAVPVVGVLGGGYSDDPDALAQRHAILFEEATRHLGKGAPS